jgi:hypothetical protein
MFFDNIHTRATDILLQQTRLDSHAINAHTMFMSEHERIMLDSMMRNAERAAFGSAWEVYHDSFRDLFYEHSGKLQRIRDLYAAYVNSRETVKLKKLLLGAVEKLLLRLIRRFNRNYRLSLLLRKQKRLRHKIKSLFPPIKIIPDSLRPIDSIA